MQEVSGVETSPLLHADEQQIALRAQKLSGTFEKRAPGHSVTPTFLSRNRFHLQ